MVLPGFNTDFKYGGETYHVQTEDNGVGNPVVVTLLYFKGAILASRRTCYRELVGNPGFEKDLQTLMKSQHKDLMRECISGAFDRKPAAAAAPSCAARPTADPPRVPPRSLDEKITRYLAAWSAGKAKGAPAR